jgi:hypothetical protein
VLQNTRQMTTLEIESVLRTLNIKEYGKIYTPQVNNSCTTGSDRINPDILDNLKKNPYAFPFNSVA